MVHSAQNPSRWATLNVRPRPLRLGATENPWRCFGNWSWTSIAPEAFPRFRRTADRRASSAQWSWRKTAIKERQPGNNFCPTVMPRRHHPSRCLDCCRAPLRAEWIWVGTRGPTSRIRCRKTRGRPVNARTAKASGRKSANCPRMKRVFAHHDARTGPAHRGVGLTRAHDRLDCLRFVGPSKLRILVEKRRVSGHRRRDSGDESAGSSQVRENYRFQ